MTDAPQETQGATGAPVETDIAVTMADPESSDAYTGSEDGLVMNDQGNTQADSIDGLPASEIRTKINEAPGNPESSRAVVSSVNQAYLFLNYYLEGRKQ